MAKNYKQIDHTADIAVQVTGDDLESLFINSGNALFDMLYDTDSIRNKESYTVKAAGDNTEELLVNFLRELFFKFVVDKTVLNDILIDKMTENEVTVTVTGERFDETRHELNMDIKAVTYHNVKILETDNKLSVTIIFDT